MTRLHLVVEGQTEEGFVNAVLVEHLAPLGVFADARCVETSHSPTRIHRGGVLDYRRASGDLLRWMKQDQSPDAHFTTMFDLFRLPSDFPNHDEAKGKPDPAARVEHLERGMADAIRHQRFIPYIQLYEFEALLLSDPARFDIAFPEPEHEEAVSNLAAMAAGFASPELIDDGPETAPSKRIIRVIPEYERRKALAGPLIAARIGLDVMRGKCRHFHKWLEKIEALSGREVG